MTRSLARVTVVRPYGERIRARVFALVQAAGYAIGDQDVIAEGIGDEDAVQRILARAARRLIVPYHGHRGRGGASLDGLALLRELHARTPAFSYRVLMPVSRFGAAAVEVAKTSMPPGLRSALLIVGEDELTEAALVARLATHFGELPST